MEKKLLCMVTIIMLISTSFVAVASDNLDETETIKSIAADIRNTKNRSLRADSTFGDIDVKSYEHKVDGFKVINDSILLQTQSGSDDVIKYKKQWRNVDEEDVPGVSSFEPEGSYKSKEKIVFLDEEDTGYFYTIEEDVSFPLFCWKVFYDNGETILYDYSDGRKIGHGIPAPSTEGFVWGGEECSCDDSDESYYDFNICKDAKNWFEKWGVPTVGIGNPEKSQISSQLSNPSVKCYYHMAHGNYDTVLLDYIEEKEEWTRYYADDAKQDMQNRPPIRFAFLGSCDAMDKLGSDTFSYIFRKGETENTVVVGYWGLGEENGTNGPFWGSGGVLRWQNNLFKYIYNGDTFKEAFNQACADFPSSDHDVRWVGDPDLTIQDILNNEPEKPEKPSGPTEGFVGKTYNFTTTTNDPEGDPIYYKWNWGDGSQSNWLGPYKSGGNITAEHQWEKVSNGRYEIKVKAKDSHGRSLWSEPLLFKIKDREPETPDTPQGPGQIKRWREYTYSASTSDPDGDNISYCFDWGDGENTWTKSVQSGETVSVTHRWTKTGDYSIKVKAKDSHGLESNWSKSLPISVPYTSNKSADTSQATNSSSIFKNFNFFKINKKTFNPFTNIKNIENSKKHPILSISKKIFNPTISRNIPVFSIIKNTLNADDILQNTKGKTNQESQNNNQEEKQNKNQKKSY